MDRLPSPDSLQFPFLQYPQERDLRIGQKFAHFIEENRPTVGQFKTAKSPLCSSREGSLLMAE